MAEIVVWTAVFVVSLGALVWASDIFIDSALEAGSYFGLPQFIIGVTIVAIGTSLPELISSLVAVVYGHSEIVLGNVVGSNVANICLIGGVTAVVVGRLRTDYELKSVDLPMFVGAAALTVLMVWDGAFTRGEALLCVAGFVLYMAYSVTVEKEYEAPSPGDGPRAEAGSTRAGRRMGWKTPLGLVVSCVLIYFGAKYTVLSVVKISGILGIGTEVIALSAVALGTSLPELAVSVSATRKGRPELVIGNVLGSNIFNSLAVMGIPGLVGTIVVPPSILGFALPVMVAVTLIYAMVVHDREVRSWEGWLFLLFYAFFLGGAVGLL